MNHHTTWGKEMTASLQITHFYLNPSKLKPTYHKGFLYKESLVTTCFP